MTEMLDTITTAIASFRNAAIAKGDFATPSAEDRRLHSVMSVAWNLCRSSDEGLIALRHLLQDPNDYVRCWVASGLLSTGDTKAQGVLELIAARTDLLGFNARTVLQEFRSGRLRSPFGH